MDDNQTPSKKKFISIQEEKLIRKVEYESIARASVHSPKKQLLLDLEILQKSSSPLKPSQRVVVSIKQRGLIPIKTIYIAEKNRFHPKRGLEKSGTRLAIGDHSSFTTHISQNTSSSASPDLDETKKQQLEDQKKNKVSLDTEITVSKHLEVESSVCNNDVPDSKLGTAGNYVVKAQSRTPIMSDNKFIKESENLFELTKDVATFTVTRHSSDKLARTTVAIVNNLISKIDQLERRIRRQDMVLHSIDPHINVSSSDEEYKDITMKSTSASGRPGCSYIEQYSHIPETSAFQRLSPSKATTIEKEHNSEQYGRDFTTYDGITARGRRQTASVPYKRDDAPKMAAERVHKIRHKLNPVRDYRLMDTVHYLAQGEFAPRDDGIKLTPSREAVLSDIIWEDVCRTHWPSARLGRRVTHPERVSTRGELQRLIDSLLRERVAHVERRRRRHYRIVKLNHRHESCRPVGKTGDIIVASHKNKPPSGEKEMGGSEHNAGSAVMSSRKWQEHSPQRSHRSHDRLISPEPSHKRHSRQDDCSPGPSYAVSRGGNNREPTCCYRASNPSRPEKLQKLTRNECKQKLTSSGSGTSGKPLGRTPRLVVKKEVSHKKCPKEEPNLEHFILLPTLVIRTPSNVKRQKKFNELYHRILNVRINNAAQLRQLARGGVDGSLERAVLAGQGRRLLAEADPLPLPSHLASLVAKCEALHDAVEKGSLLELQVLLCRDEAGAGLLHKAVYYDYTDIAEWLVDNYPQLVHQKDSVILSIKRHNIRIWCHDCDMARLQRVVWEGHGSRLLSEVSNQPVVKKFLEAVPYMMDSQVVEEPQHANEEHGENEAQEEGESAEDEAQEKEDEHVEEHNEETEENPDKEVQDADEVHVIEIKDEDGKADYVNKMEDSEENTTEHVDSKRNDDSENHNMDNHDNENETGDQTFGHDHIGEEHNHEKKDDVENHSDIKSESNLEENKVLNEDEANHKSENSKLNESNQLENDVPNHEHEDTNHREESSNLVNDHKQNSGLDGHENDDHNKSDIKEAEDDQNKKEHNTNDEKVMDADTKVEEESFATTKEGNNNNDHSEDDDDVQVQGDCNSEYSDTNLRSTAELSDTKSAKRGNLTDGRSTQESLIEGIISGEAELDYQDASITQREESVHADELAVDSEIDPEVTELINSANMEMLAALVLNGEGSRLIGRRSGNAELQAFLDNVSTYMQKINKVHLAAKDGNIRDLQAALDRRKFAIARDSISPNGATPLHVATVFGKTNIMKYLGGRFPETLSAVDFEGRTALHYAAILPDNGHYFNLLQQLGANAKDLDDNGRSAEDYQKNPSLLPFNQLISDFGISKEAAQEMLSDKDLHNINVHSDLSLHPPSDFVTHKRPFAKSTSPTEPLVELNVDPNDEFVLSGTIECSRNMQGFELPINLKIGKLEAIERIITTILMRDDFLKLSEQSNPESDQKGGTYYTMNEILEKPSEISASLAAAGLLIALCDREEIDDYTRLHGRHWPYGRGVYVSDDKTFAVWINVHDHIPLGDPLIKGLTEVANVKPKDPVAFLASFLHNFPENEKPRIGTQQPLCKQESNVLVTQEAAEVENDQPPPQPEVVMMNAPVLSRSAARTATRPHRPIDVITVDPRSEASPDAPEAAFSSADRDEHGQSMLHFAAARTHTRNALFQLLQESDVNLAFRDELYRTARDVSLQANVPENTTEIDRWVLHLAAREGYDHILDVVDDDGVPITEVESREELHGAIRRGDLASVEATLSAEGGRTLARSKSSFGRTALHVAVLAQHEEIVAFLAAKFPELLRFGDNLERSPLHYAMGVEKIESLSRVLIRAGAKRVLKDLKGRQPSYYFMNKSDILRLKEEEEVY
ncbi:hypothetical protein MSG28_010142 [Choristoneura fumiferana]|uniref:Uncharacterized protein n=1 Tax=Choristoneura fumiferana TaxID=7141 RepID=A0ACC0KJJ4_CHOFU|nr:hypothetical protein MSG28_010142 [Choristoneura fumiferana]